MYARMCKTNLKAQLMAAMEKQREHTGQWECRIYAGPPSIALHPVALSVLPSLAPSDSSLGHWGEWTAILILILLSLCGPLAERGEWSPGFWNLPPLSSGH